MTCGHMSAPDQAADTAHAIRALRRQRSLCDSTRGFLREHRSEASRGERKAPARCHQNRPRDWVVPVGEAPLVLLTPRSEVDALISACERILDRVQDAQHRRLELRETLVPTTVEVQGLAAALAEQLRRDRLALDLQHAQAEAGRLDMHTSRVEKMLAYPIAASDDARLPASLPAPGVQAQERIYVGLESCRGAHPGDSSGRGELAAHAPHLGAEIGALSLQPRVEGNRRKRDRMGLLNQVLAGDRAHRARPRVAQCHRPRRGHGTVLQSEYIRSRDRLGKGRAHCLCDFPLTPGTRKRRGPWQRFAHHAVVGPSSLSNLDEEWSQSNELLLVAYRHDAGAGAWRGEMPEPTQHPSWGAGGSFVGYGQRVPLGNECLKCREVAD